MDYNTVEKARLEYAKKLKSPMTICIILVMIMIVLGIAVGSISLTIFSSFAIFIIGYCMAVFNSKKERTNYHKAYKGYFVEQNLKKIFTDLYYSRDEGISSSVLDSTGMIRTGDRYNTNDYVKGKYHDVDFQQADVLIQEEHTDSDGDTYYVTIFKGRWMTFEFPKKFAYRIEVVQKNFPASKVPSAGPNGRKFEKQQIESPTFHEKFKIYAEDGFETFYVLDPALINHIETLSQNSTGKMLLCFIDNKLHVALHDNKDAFEPPKVSKKIDEKVETEKIYNEIKTLTDFIDYLKLDKKIFGNN